MGNLLVSGNGKGHSAIVTLWVSELAFAAICFAIAMLMANYLGNQATRAFLADRRGLLLISNFLRGVGILAIAAAIYNGLYATSKIAKTEISVYERGVQGKSLPPKFPWTFGSSMSEFQLNYDQISSVDVLDGKSIVIHAASMQHKCYAMNAGEIRDAIFRQKNPGNQ